MATRLFITNDSGKNCSLNLEYNLTNVWVKETFTKTGNNSTREPLKYGEVTYNLSLSLSLSLSLHIYIYIYIYISIDLFLDMLHYVSYLLLITTYLETIY